MGKKCPSRGGNQRDRDEERDNNRMGGSSAENQNNEQEGGDDDDDDVPSSDPQCEMTDWSDEGCTCENGQKREHRKFKNTKYERVCRIRYSNVKIEREVTCGTSDCPATTRKVI